MTLLKKWYEVYIGLGSNLDNPEQHIIQARNALVTLKNSELAAFSPMYDSLPLGPQDQPNYVNAVMRIKTGLSAQELLAELQQIENMHGRVRLKHWGARTLDLDILLYYNQIINQPNLQVPHPEMTNRGFVLYPLADIADAELIIPGKGRLKDLLAACPPVGLRRIES
ncbi:MAG: 2-amino-4-hydroxy-6-hydroxymethyldihydropteridine diphosphokinase [Methylomonas sp.]|jgi:2-amino-4-hydroxy-6-hydroxymethyldihydropteridine diphosphokinase